MSEDRTKPAYAAFLKGFASALFLAAAALGGVLAFETTRNAGQANAALPVFRVNHTEYGPQKVVYHVATRGSWRDRESEAWRLIAVLNNHIRAVEPADLSVTVIFQGDGIDALKRAKGNPNLAAAFDNLSKRGVSFRVCANTLEAYRLGLETLHGIKESDLVQAGVAELIHLQNQGYAYIKF